MIRVLFLTESFHPVLGGGEGHIRALGRGLASAGLPVTVLTRRGESGWPAAVAGQAAWHLPHFVHASSERRCCHERSVMRL